MTRPPLEVADVVQRYGAAYLARYRSTLSPEQQRALRAIALCRTGALGGHKPQCEQCGHEEIAYTSCRNRHCPKCQGMARAAEVLEVPYYFQTVVRESRETIPLIFWTVPSCGRSITAAFPLTANCATPGDRGGLATMGGGGHPDDGPWPARRCL